VTARIAVAFQRAAAQDALRAATAAEERLRLGRDLHDGVLQGLAGAALKLTAALEAHSPSPGLRTSIDQVRELLAHEQRELRRFIGRVRPDSAAVSTEAVVLFDDLDLLASALRMQWELEVKVQVHPAVSAVPGRLAHQLRHMVREAAANAAKHGKAHRLSVSATVQADVVRLHLNDDGIGLPVHGQFDAAALRSQGIGPRSLRERVISLGGSFRLESAPSGVSITVEVPRSVPQE
jgi:signal transduction histidine kinase